MGTADLVCVACLPRGSHFSRVHALVFALGGALSILPMPLTLPPDPVCDLSFGSDSYMTQTHDQGSPWLPQDFCWPTGKAVPPSYSCEI